MALFAASSHAGTLVTVDGPSGSGKSSLARALAGEIAGRGLAVHLTSQPSRSPLGRLARTSEAGLRGRSLACLVAADRHQQNVDEIGPRLAAGSIVVVDRYIESSLVLQALDGVPREFILAVNADIIRPDLRILIATSAVEIRRRLAARSELTRLEAENDVQRELDLYDNADALLADAGVPSVRIDSSADLPAVVAQATAAVMEALQCRRAAAPDPR